MEQTTPTPARPALDAMAAGDVSGWSEWLRKNYLIRNVEDRAAAHNDIADFIDKLISERNAALRAVADMRGALEETSINLELVERPKFKDPDYGAEVEALGERIGYGALMSSAQASWRASNARRGFPDGGEFVAGPCYATVMKNLEMVRTALARSAP